MSIDYGAHDAVKERIEGQVVIAGMERRCPQADDWCEQDSSKSIAVTWRLKYLRLHRHYEAALRRWEQVEWASNKNQAS